MSNAAPIMIIFVLLIGGIVAWGAMTDWTFSGLLPRAGAKCKPETPATNANQYVYNNANPPACTVIATCNTDWAPAKSNTVCEYSKSDSTCTPEGTPDPEGVYTFNKSKKCNLTGCKNNFKFISASAGCKSCKDGYTKDGTVCRKCKVTDVPALISSTTFKDLSGLTYKTENGNCIPNRMIFDGNDGSANCHTYCAGTNGGPWKTVTPPEWKGAKCVGVTNGVDHTTFSATVKCETKRMGTDKKLTADDTHDCVCERNDATPWVNKGWSMKGGERLFGKSLSKSYLEINKFAAADGAEIKTTDNKNPDDVSKCLAIAKTKGYKAIAVRTTEHGSPGWRATCLGYTQAALDKKVKTHYDTYKASNKANAEIAKNSHYMVCVDDNTKKVYPNYCA
jgi:hypothetical protein